MEVKISTFFCVHIEKYGEVFQFLLHHMAYGSNNMYIILLPSRKCIKELNYLRNKKIVFFFHLFAFFAAQCFFFYLFRLCVICALSQ